MVNLNTGDDTYGFGAGKIGYAITRSGTTRDVGFTIHDTGGAKTINFSGFTARTVLDLPAGHYPSVNGHENNVSIFARHNADQSEYYIERGIDRFIGNRSDNHFIALGSGDYFNGGSGDDTLDTGADADVLHGDAGDDLLTGAIGNDTLTGGDWGDQFIFEAGFGKDTITDFLGTADDVIHLARSLFSSVDAIRAAAAQVGGDTVIAVNTLTLSNVQLSALQQDDFMLVKTSPRSGEIWPARGLAIFAEAAFGVVQPSITSA